MVIGIIYTKQSVGNIIIYEGNHYEPTGIKGQHLVTPGFEHCAFGPHFKAVHPPSDPSPEWVSGLPAGPITTIEVAVNPAGRSLPPEATASAGSGDAVSPIEKQPQKETWKTD